MTRPFGMIVLLDWMDDCMFEFYWMIGMIKLFGLNGPLNWLDWLGDWTKGIIGLINWLDDGTDVNFALKISMYG